MASAHNVPGWLSLAGAASRSRFPHWASLMARQAVSGWVNTKYCPECGFVRKDGHAEGCIFPSIMGEIPLNEVA